jgi:hydrogenase small subunit
MLEETVKDAFAVIAIGSCAAFGGIPGANPNPTGAVPVSEIIKDKPLINISGCPPIPEAMTGTLAYLLSFGSIPELDHLGRPKAFFGETIHDRCYRRPFYDRGMFAKSFDDEGARQGWCLYEVGCKGPVTYNACATLKWNGGVSFPVQSGHGCLGCSEPGFWDMGGFYKPLSTATGDSTRWVAGAAAAGAAIGAASALAARHQRKISIKETSS